MPPNVPMGYAGPVCQCPINPATLYQRPSIKEGKPPLPLSPTPDSALSKVRECLELNKKLWDNLFQKGNVNWGATFGIDFGLMNEALLATDRTLSLIDQPQDQSVSDEEIETFAKQIIEERDWIHNENRRALGEAVMIGAKWALERVK